MSDWLGLDGERVLVAGGGGTIGRALVDGFLGSGARVAVTDVSDDAMAGLDDRVSVRHARDLSDAAAARAAVASVREELGGLDVFVHCVGINDRRPIEDYSASDWDRIIGVNLTSALHTGRPRPRSACASRPRPDPVLLLGGQPQRATSTTARTPPPRARSTT